MGDRRGLGVFQHESVQQLGVWLVDMPVENRKQALGDVMFPKVYHLLGGKDTVLYLAQKVRNVGGLPSCLPPSPLCLSSHVLCVDVMSLGDRDAA